MVMDMKDFFHGSFTLVPKKAKIEQLKYISIGNLASKKNSRKGKLKKMAILLDKGVVVTLINQFIIGPIKGYKEKRQTFKQHNFQK
jgi:hypothetical protein